MLSVCGGCLTALARLGGIVLMTYYSLGCFHCCCQALIRRFFVKWPTEGHDPIHLLTSLGLSGLTWVSASIDTLCTHSEDLITSFPLTTVPNTKENF